MPAYIKAQLYGLERTIAALQALDKKVRGPLARNAVRSGGSVLRKEAARRVPKRTRQLQKSLGIKVKTYPSGVTLAIIGPRKGFKVSMGKDEFGKPLNIDPVRYAHLPEKGRGPVQVKNKQVLSGQVWGHGKGRKATKIFGFTIRKKKNAGPVYLGRQIFGLRAKGVTGQFWLLGAYQAMRYEMSAQVAAILVRGLVRAQKVTP